MTAIAAASRAWARSHGRLAPGYESEGQRFESSRARQKQRGPIST